VYNIIIIININKLIIKIIKVVYIIITTKR